MNNLYGKPWIMKTLIIGLDGVPRYLLEQLAASDVMPALQRLIQEGTLHDLAASIPEISSVSWTSFMTGADPGTHGIFGFTDIKPGTYQNTFPMFSDLKAPTFWDQLGQSGKTSVVINQPGTYPARDIPGVLVSGFVAIELAKAVRPLRYLAPLRRADYDIDIDTQRCRKDHDQLFRELEKTLQGRKAIVEHAWKDVDWDYFQVVITGTDRLQHYLFSAIEDENHKRHDQAMEYYSKIDGFIKDIWERFHDSADVEHEGQGFYMLSDHGFTLIEQEVYINAWLKQQGYLAFEKDDPQSLADISPHTKAFALDPGRIYIHRKDKYPKGKVDREEAEGLISEIRGKLLDLTYNNKKVIQMAPTKAEAYHGPETPKGPDLVAVGHHGFDIKGSITGEDIFRRTDLTGMHTWDDAFFWSGQDVKDNLVITDLAVVIMDGMLKSRAGG